jgi:peptide/nickel transport system permease protein
LPPTLSIAVIAEIIAIGIAVPLGVFAASRPGTASDRAARGFTLFGMTVPSFLLGLFLMLLFAVRLKWFPVSGYKPLNAGLWAHLRHLVLPAGALGLIQSALLARITRSAMLEVLNESYVRTARAKGAREAKVIYWHALRNALMPIITVVGTSFGALVAGAVVVESIFNIPGLGHLLVSSVQRRDYALIQGTVLFVAFMTVIINLLVDLLYAVVDPRVRLNRL